MRKLIDWYQANKRDLPWRNCSDPYYTWISEIMLQQTQVSTVIPYFNKFIKVFPTIEKLANASEEEVLKNWEGLGYYSRARNLHKCSKVILKDYSGSMPKSKSELLKLPGIGPYTAGAIMSIAFNQKHAAVDGNVFRVFSRLFMIEDDISLPKSRKVFEEKVLLEMKNFEPADFNQALMDFGANICSAKQPKCSECPMQQQCQAFAIGRELEYPVKNKRVKQRIVPMIVVVVENSNQQYMLRKRPDEGLLAGLYEFITFEGDGEDDLMNYVNLHFDLTIEKISKLGEVNHAFTHLKWVMNVYHVKVNSSSEKMFSIDELHALPISTAHRKVLKMIA